MSLVILGKEDVDVLAAWAAAKFAAVRNNGSKLAIFPGHPYDGRTGVVHLTVPVKDTRNVTVVWAAPEARSTPRRATPRSACRWT
jgi:secreted Zn-dependent insulinase-like peptidase